MSESVLIDGHVVDARRADEFYNGSDGSRVTDAQWDESKQRSQANPRQVNISELGFEHVGDCCPPGDVIVGELDE